MEHSRTGLVVYQSSCARWLCAIIPIRYTVLMKHARSRVSGMAKTQPHSANSGGSALLASRAEYSTFGPSRQCPPPVGTRPIGREDAGVKPTRRRAGRFSPAPQHFIRKRLFNEAQGAHARPTSRDTTRAPRHTHTGRRECDEDDDDDDDQDDDQDDEDRDEDENDEDEDQDQDQDDDDDDNDNNDEKNVTVRGFLLLPSSILSPFRRRNFYR